MQPTDLGAFLKQPLEAQRKLLVSYIDQLLDTNPSVQQIAIPNGASIDRYYVLGVIPFNLYAILHLNTIVISNGSRDQYGYPITLDKFDIHGKGFLGRFIKNPTPQTEISLVARAKKIAKKNTVY